MLTDEEIDRHLDAILRASGSALRYYSMNTTKEKMRKALRGAIEAAHAALSGAQSQWMPIETAPAGDSVILCTTGGHVGEAFVPEHYDYPWRWAGTQRTLHANHKPLGWMPMPEGLPDPEGVST